MRDHWYTSSAPGKFVILGEHAVVYGKPAIVLAADLRMTVAVRRSRWNTMNGERLDLFRQPLEFFEPDMDKFRCLALAFEAIRKGGNMPCIVNAANEVVNRGFLEDRCSFMQMSDIIEKTMNRVSFSEKADYDTYVATDAEARRVAEGLLEIKN